MKDEGGREGGREERKRKLLTKERGGCTFII